MSNYKETATQVVEAIGGKENINNAWHCVTRLRFNLKDKNNIPIDKIKKIPGVMGAQFSGDQFQVIIGNTVADVFEEVDLIVGDSDQGDITNSDEGFLSKLFDIISAIFTPIVPALAGTGLLKGFLALAVIFGWTTAESSSYQVIYGLADSVLYFLPFLLAVSTARKFRTSEYLSLALAGAMMYPTYLTAAQNAMQASFTGGEAPAPWHMFGVIPLPLVSYASSVLPIIFSVVVLKYVVNWVKKWMPDSLTLMFTPMVALLITFPIAMVIIGPIGTYAGNFVGDGIAWLFEVGGPFAGLVLGATYPLLVITGMHYSLAPISLTSYAKNGFENVVTPINSVTNLAQSGSAFAVVLRTKNSSMRQIAISSGISASIGITEPAMYGVTLKLKRPFYAALAGGGIAGGFSTFMNLKAYGGGGMPGLFSIPAFIHDKDTMNVVWFIVALALSWLLSFIFTLVLGFKEEVEEEILVEEKPEIVVDPVEKNRIFSPLNGKIMLLKNVADETFAQELVGKGIAIVPTEKEVYAPISGEIKLFPESKHAIGILGDNGVEVLVHIGIDTVELGGEGFNLELVVGSHVEKGQLLGTVDFEGLLAKGVDITTMVIVTNTLNYTDVSPAQEEGIIFKEEELVHII
ncbi:beta-glucoside-specific PTS transporter subunit IIABC [Vagococcus intermedius]|uniref:PTS system sucrose-specific EIIBCA component n=1 Tax=Vagococcus intermedius TaxID=2991418 RepID=A0AAF0CVW2_9ENTE|nr:beta-glucoside-specific PTS transporter subunit IIABC [Vagococcus intermedius]WEG73968.1 beta-glucoside-specific PTS transporter subunit IIABC [Vagococcus intermedius]WEG76048.1 beta-glucoside-specific PTS transporter subunit IIABC [Vagococcus intermedius]